MQDDSPFCRTVACAEGCLAWCISGLHLCCFPSTKNRLSNTNWVSNHSKTTAKPHFLVFHRCYNFLQIESKTLHWQNGYNSIYCDTCFVVVWNQTSNISKVVSYTASINGSRVLIWLTLPARKWEGKKAQGEHMWSFIKAWPGGNTYITQLYWAPREGKKDIAVYAAKTQNSVKKEGGKLYWPKTVSITPLFLIMLYSVTDAICSKR